jgi:hypothetical protein
MSILYFKLMLASTSAKGLRVFILFGTRPYLVSLMLNILSLFVLHFRVCGRHVGRRVEGKDATIQSMVEACSVVQVCGPVQSWGSGMLKLI